MDTIRKNGKVICIVLLVGFMAIIWYAVFYFEARQNLRVTFFDVGQGDAIFIEIPGGNQILIDGGPDEKVLSKLGRAMPFWDRSIDMVILTHPHADHVNGFVEVLKRYQVKQVLMTGVEYFSSGYAAFLDEIYQRKIPVIFPTGKNDFQLGTAVIDMLFPFNAMQGRSFDK